MMMIKTLVLSISSFFFFRFSLRILYVRSLVSLGICDWEALTEKKNLN